MTTQATAPAQKDNRSLVASDGFRAEIEKAAPKHVDARRLQRVALTAITKNPALLKCDRASFATAVLQAAELGLEPSGALGHAYLIPYGAECQLIVSFKGMVALARRSGEILSIEARAVYERDTFSLSYGLTSNLEHTPYLDGDSGPLRFVYAVAKLKDGGVQFDVMSRSQVDAIRARSRAGKSGPWVTDYDEMAKKTVVRRLFKMLPVSVELAEVFEKDDASEFGELTPTNIGNVNVPPASSTGRTGDVENALLPAGEESVPAAFVFTTAAAVKLSELIKNAPHPGEVKKLDAEIEKHAKAKDAVPAEVEELRASLKRVADEYARVEAEANAQ